MMKCDRLHCSALSHVTKGYGLTFKRLNMSNDTKYNGWTNYATWRVNLEVFDGFDPFDNFSDNQAKMMEWLPDTLKEYAEEIIEQTSSEGLARDYARAFLSDVNWFEIAEHMFLDYADEEDIKAYKEGETAS
jgi:hypothetical protein